MRWLKIRSQEKMTRALIARNFSASRMNRTKWMELVETLQDLNLCYRIKFVDEEGITDWAWLMSPHPLWLEIGAYGPFRPVSIEWLEIDPYNHIGRHGEVVASDYSGDIENRLASLNIPFDIIGGLFRITGHVRYGTI